jgi:hypothetical protein
MDSIFKQPNLNEAVIASQRVARMRAPLARNDGKIHLSIPAT